MMDSLAFFPDSIYLCFSYNEGMLDITASYVEMVGKPREIFKDLNKGHTSTRYEIYTDCTDPFSYLIDNLVPRL